MARPDNHYCAVRALSLRDTENGAVHLPVLVGCISETEAAQGGISCIINSNSNSDSASAGTPAPNRVSYMTSAGNGTCEWCSGSGEASILFRMGAEAYEIAPYPWNPPLRQPLLC